MADAATAELPSTSTSAAQNGRTKNRGGGNLAAMFPNREVVWIDDDLKEAIDLACSIEKERAAVLLRRWLRRSAISEGYLVISRPAGG